MKCCRRLFIIVKVMHFSDQFDAYTPTSWLPMVIQNARRRSAKVAASTRPVWAGTRKGPHFNRRVPKIPLENGDVGSPKFYDNGI